METIVETAIIPHKLPDPVMDHLAGLNFDRCFTCGTCTSGCPVTETPGMEKWDIRKVLRMLYYGMIDRGGRITVSLGLYRMRPLCSRMSHGYRYPIYHAAYEVPAPQR